MRCPHRTVAHGKVAGAGRLRTAASQGPSGGWNVRSHPARDHPIEADRERSCRSLAGGNGSCRRNPRHGERKNPAREVPDAQHGNPNADDRRVSAFLRQGHETDHAPRRRLAQDSGGRNPVCTGGRRASILPDRHRFQRAIGGAVSRTHPDAAILVAGRGTTGRVYRDFAGLPPGPEPALSDARVPAGGYGVQVLLRYRRANRISNEDLAAIGVARGCVGEKGDHTRRPMRCAREGRLVWTGSATSSETLRTQLQTHTDGRPIDRGQPHWNRPRTCGRVRYSSSEAREIRPPQAWRRVCGCMAGDAMTSPFLVRHPAPFRTESLFGYILRLSEQNGYTTPWSLFLLAQIRQHEARSTGMKVAKLAQICNRPQNELQSISYRWPGDHRRSCRLLGHLLTPWELVVARPRLCPECVAEKGFIEAHFDLALMTGCPIHRRSLLCRCPGCMKPLRWFRPGLLECHCGTSLRNADLPAISGAEADLLDIMRRKILGLAAGRNYASGLPGSCLEVMNLQALLSLVGMLGRRRMVVDNGSDRRNAQHIVFAAASVLADWPNNFFRLLRGITEGMPTDASTGVARGRLGGIYRSLLNLRRIMPTEQADFLRIAFLDFVRNDWRPDFIDQKLMKRIRTGQSERFISRAAFARRYGIDTRAAARFLEDQGVPSRTFRWGKSERKLIDSAAATLSPTVPGKIYRLRQAAAMVGISSELLKCLKASGDFEVNHLLRTKPGFHELDIEAFIQRLNSLAPPVNPADLSSSKYVRFAIVARGWYGSVEAKAHIVRAVLSRKLPVVGDVDGTVAGLLVSYEGFQRLAHDERARAHGDTRTIAEAARQLDCNTRSVRRLVELEWLTASRASKALRVTEESIAEFKKRYVSLVSIARTTNSASWALQNICKRCNVPLLVASQPSKKSSQAFIRAGQRQELLGLRSGLSLKSLSPAPGGR